MAQYAEECILIVANRLPALISQGIPERRVSQFWTAIIVDNAMSLMVRYQSPALPARKIRWLDSKLEEFLKGLALHGVEVVKEYLSCLKQFLRVRLNLNAAVSPGLEGEEETRKFNTETESRWWPSAGESITVMDAFCRGLVSTTSASFTITHMGQLIHHTRPPWFLSSVARVIMHSGLVSEADVALLLAERDLLRYADSVSSPMKCGSYLPRENPLKRLNTEDASTALDAERQKRQRDAPEAEGITQSLVGAEKI